MGWKDIYPLWNPFIVGSVAIAVSLAMGHEMEVGMPVTASELLFYDSISVSETCK